MSDDTLVLPVLDAVLGCLLAELATSPSGSPCAGFLAPAGPLVPADACGCGRGGSGGCGQAWVRLDRTYPYRQYPAQDTTPGCDGPLAAVIELGVLRCLPTVATNGQPPTPAALTQATIGQMGDWNALRRTAKCCEELARRDVVLGAYLPRSQGGCGGGTLTITVRLGIQYGPR